MGAYDPCSSTIKGNLIIWQIKMGLKMLQQCDAYPTMGYSMYSKLVDITIKTQNR